MLYSKLRFATVTESNMRYNGSIGICKQIMKDLDIVEGQVVNVNSLDGSVRTQTYVIPEDEPGAIVIRGGLASLLYKGDDIHINVYCSMSKESALEHKPIVIESNKPYIKKK